MITKIIATICLLLIINVADCQNIEDLKKTKPFTLSGSIGASANYYTSNENVATRPPWSWNLYGNFSPKIYGISMPVSFVLNQYGNSYTQPFAQFGISPTYKWAKLHLGYRTIMMSPMVFSGQSFRGAGIELTPGLLRFAAFYGKLNRKVNEDTTAGKFASPQFSRTGYGIKVGVGNKKHFFDLIYFYAKDDTTSAVVINKTKIKSEENAVLGASFKTTIKRKFTWTGDIAVSGITNDLNAPGRDTSEGGFLESVFKNFMPIKNSTIFKYGGQTSLNVALKNYNTTVGYRRVEQGFKSLGTPYMINDIELVNWMNNFNLLKNKLNINTVISNQHNNLNKDQTSEMSTFVSNLSINAMPSQKVNLNLNYSGYIIKQNDGTIKLSDSVRLNQLVHQINFMPSYTIFNSIRSHTISTNINYMILDDKNPVSSPSTSSKNLSASLNYTLGLSKKGISFTASGLYNQYVQDTNRYTTYGVNVGSSGQFLKNKNLIAQVTAGYMLNQSTFNEAQSNLTFSGIVSYRLKKHSLSVNANYVYTPYNPINEVIERALSKAVASQNFMGNITYNYSF